jgi:hypothetical protein
MKLTLIEETRPFEYVWPSGITEHYESCLRYRIDGSPDGLNDGEVSLAFGYREAFGANRRRIPVFRDKANVLVEFVGTDDYSETSNVAWNMKQSGSNKGVRKHPDIPPEFRPFDVDRCNEWITGPNARSTYGVRVNESDHEGMIHVALIREQQRKQGGGSSDGKIDLRKDILKLAVDKAIRPRLERGDFEADNREGYHHSKVLPRAQPELTREALQRDATTHVWTAVSACVNMLSSFEQVRIRAFLKQCDPDALSRHLIDLLHSSEDLVDRVDAFLQWGGQQKAVDGDETIGFTSTAVSYLLAMVNPKECAFCKPTVYKKAAAMLLGPSNVVTDAAHRIAHATAFYQETLRLLTEEHRLPFDDLLHVHSVFFVLQPNYSGDLPSWDELCENGPGPDPIEPIVSDETGRLLLDRKNVLLYGPPGTGKTHKTLQLAKIWRKSQGHDSVDQVTFHPSYAYEDFIEGYRPGDNGDFERRDGLFVQIADKARQHPDRQFLLIIDEINRGDVARLFGELITLIEPDKRSATACRRLPYSQREFWVPANLHLLGTMNTADRSISLLDIAIRRRFCFVEVRPDPELLSSLPDHAHDVSGVSLQVLLGGINQRLAAAGVDRERAIGHSYFIIPANVDDALGTLRERLAFDVLPLIEEYCFADRQMLRRIVGDLVDDHGEFDRELLDDDDRLVAALRKLATID